jgi:hypothetical protein
MCGWWASHEFRAISDRDRASWRSKQCLHRYGADEDVRKTQRMV